MVQLHNSIFVAGIGYVAVAVVVDIAGGVGAACECVIVAVAVDEDGGDAGVVNAVDVGVTVIAFGAGMIEDNAVDTANGVVSAFANPDVFEHEFVFSPLRLADQALNGAAVVLKTSNCDAAFDFVTVPSGDSRALHYYCYCDNNNCDGVP